MPDEQKAVTVVRGWRQQSLLSREAVKAVTLSRRKWIMARLREESREKEKDDAGGRLARQPDREPDRDVHECE
jgi:hypothetical protein